MEKDLQTLLELSKQIHTLASVERLLFWDQETMMPEGAIDIKSLQQKEIATILHQKRTSKEYASALSKFIDLETGEIKKKGLSEEWMSNLTSLQKDYAKQVKLPESFVKELAEASSKSTHIWIEARKNDDFNLFCPYLENIIHLMKRKADYLGYEDHPYNALIDEYEPEMTVKKLDSLFIPLEKELISLTKMASQNKVDDAFLAGHFEEGVQKKLYTELLEAMGLKKPLFRLDHSAHPFCMAIHPTDLRLTTHFHSKGFFDALSATMHEGGHGLYEQGLKIENFGLPTGEASSMGVHESQSKFWETCIGMSLPFCKGYFPLLQKAFGKELGSISVETFYKAINKVTPSFIRIHADEVTYGLHIILRYEIEKGFMEGKYQVKDLPEIWNEKMQKLLGITPPKMSQGCLQDIHWASALFGYFPTYALGNLYAAELFLAIKKAYPDYEKRLENKEYLFMAEWLESKVHVFGRMYPPEKLISRATGKAVSSTPFLHYLKEKYQQ